MNKRTVGADKEQIAAAFLKDQGYRILQQNFRSRTSEIDLVAWDPARMLCFVEVKYRRTVRSGYPIEAVDRHKQRRICRCADFYRVRYHVPEDMPCRFDVIAILGEQITWYKNAFDYIR